MTQKFLYSIRLFIAGLLILSAGLQGCTTTPTKDVPVAQPKWIAFDAVTYWNTNYGPMKIELKGDRGEGLYPNYQGTLELMRKKTGVLEGFWTQPSSEKKCNTLRGDSAFWGTVRFVRTTEDTIEGQWAYCDSPKGSGGIWRGVRIGHI